MGEGRALDWEEVPAHRRLTVERLERRRARYWFLAQDDRLFGRWVERVTRPSCHRAVTCYLWPELLVPCVRPAARGERYCVAHGGRRAPRPAVTPLRPEEVQRFGRDFAGLTVRTRTTLWRNWIVRARTVAAMTDDALLHLRNFGDAALEEVREHFPYRPAAPPAVSGHPWWLQP
jgi:hypothetical protein